MSEIAEDGKLPAACYTLSAESVGEGGEAWGAGVGLDGSVVGVEGDSLFGGDVEAVVEFVVVVVFVVEGAGSSR